MDNLKTRQVHAACSCGWLETYGCDADDAAFVEHHHGHDVRGTHPFDGTLSESFRRPSAKPVPAKRK